MHSTSENSTPSWPDRKLIMGLKSPCIPPVKTVPHPGQTESLWECNYVYGGRGLELCGVVLTSSTIFLGRHQPVFVGSCHNAGVKTCFQGPAYPPWKRAAVLFKVHRGLCCVHQSWDTLPSPFGHQGFWQIWMYANLAKEY